MIKTIIFDLDGVLIESKEIHFKALNQALPFNYRISYEEHLSTYDGLPTREKLKLLSENLKVTISFLEEKPLSVELPTNIECEIENTEGVVKKQTASSSYKPAKLKNGLDIIEN